MYQVRVYLVQYYYPCYYYRYGSYSYQVLVASTYVDDLIHSRPFKIPSAK